MNFFTPVAYYKPMAIVNDDSRVVNELKTLPTDDARVVIYNRHMFIVQATVQVEQYLTEENQKVVSS